MFNVKIGEKTLSFDSPVTVYDAAKEALEAVPREVLCAKVNGKTAATINIGENLRIVSNGAVFLTE